MASMRHGLVGAGVVCGLVWVGAGCATYANYPAIGGDAAVNDPNVVPLPSLATTALRWVVEQHPVEGEYVVNLPQGTEYERAGKMARSVGEGARLVSEATSGLPAYHVSRIWLRGDRAEVDVMRPVTGGAHQMMTVRMKNDLGRWIVTSTRAWPVGMGKTPELFGWEQPGEGMGVVASESDEE